MNQLPSYLERFVPIAYLETFFPRSTQSRLRLLAIIGMVGGTVLYGAITFFELPISRPLVLGATILMAGFYLEQLLLRLYHNYYYFAGLDSFLGKGYHRAAPITYDAAMTLLIDTTDITKALLTSKLGQEIHLAAHLSSEVVTAFLQYERTPISIDILPRVPTETITVDGLVEIIIAHDQAFVAWLNQQNNSAGNFRRAAQLIQEAADSHKRSLRWWSRDALSRQHSVGKQLANYQRSIPYTSDIRVDTIKPIATSLARTVHELHEVLATTATSHCLLLAGDTDTNEAIIKLLARDLASASVLNAVAGKCLSVLDTKTLTAPAYTAAMVESALITVLEEATTNRHSILVIPELAHFIIESSAKGVAVTDIFDTYTSSNDLHLIGCDTIRNRHSIRESWPQFALTATEVIANEVTNDHETNQKVVARDLYRQFRPHVSQPHRVLKTIATAHTRYQHSRQDTTTTRPTALLFLGPDTNQKHDLVATMAKIYGLNQLTLTSELEGASMTETLLATVKDAATETAPSLILIEDIETLNRDVQRTLAAALETGTINDGLSNPIDCRQIIFVVTSSVGSTLIERTKQLRNNAPHLDREVIAHIRQQALLEHVLLHNVSDIIVCDTP
jgi:ATP-dependent Clp protease ATP-binding subunit ClpA